MTKVWIVSGFVLIGTGLSLAVFGAWLSGNANCDAGDLGRSCVAASLGVAVVGAALSLAGWMRVRRTQGADASDEGASGFLARRPGLALLAFSLVGIILLTVVLPGPQPPARIFMGGAPNVGQDPADFLTADLAGFARTDLTTAERNLTAIGEAGYGAGVFVRVTRFNASENWTYYPPCANPAPGACPTVPPETRNNQSVANATADADLYLSGQYSALSGGASSRLCVREGPRLWFSVVGPQGATLAWRDGTFVFEVIAPTEAARNALSAALGAAS